MRALLNWSSAFAFPVSLWVARSASTIMPREIRIAEQKSLAYKMEAMEEVVFECLGTIETWASTSNERGQPRRPLASRVLPRVYAREFVLLVDARHSRYATKRKEVSGVKRIAMDDRVQRKYKNMRPRDAPKILSQSPTRLERSVKDCMIFHTAIAGQFSRSATKMGHEGNEDSYHPCVPSCIPPQLCTMVCSHVPWIAYFLSLISMAP